MKQVDKKPTEKNVENAKKIITNRIEILRK